jgi:hypothetical protein
VLAVVLVTASSVAVAGPSAQDLQAQGEQLAKDGRYSEAIDAFKAADKQQPTASHACLIALAYTRRELWPQAEIFLARCHERATPADPLPDWVPVAEQQIAERLATANAAPVTIEVVPAQTAVQLTVSSFAPDETFSPRTIHLPPGHYVILATAPDMPVARKDVVVETKDPQTVTFDLRAATPPIAPRVNALAHDAVGRPHHSPWKRRLLVGGAVLAGGGLVTYGWMGYEWSQLRTQDSAQWDAHDGNYSLARGLTIGLWAAGGAAIVTSLFLPGSYERQVAVAPLPGGGMVSVGWSR